MNYTNYFAKRKKIASLLRSHRGCRIGETTVCSRKIHAFDPANPQSLTIITNADAGAVFYKRRLPQEIVHLDVFHSLGTVPPPLIAQAVKQGLARYADSIAFHSGQEAANAVLCWADYFDVQTAGGGGRVTGHLRFGQRTSLRTAHLNHVHLSGKLQDKDLAAVFFLVLAIEDALLAAGFQLRRVETLSHEFYENEAEQAPALSFQSQNDSFLAERKSFEESLSGVGSAMLADMVEDSADLDDLHAVLQCLRRQEERGRRASFARRPSEAESNKEFWQGLKNYGLMTDHGGRSALTEAGRAFSRWLGYNLKDLQVELKREEYFALPINLNPARLHETVNYASGQGKGMPVARSRQGGVLALNPTLNTALLRRLESGGGALRFQVADLRVCPAPKRRSTLICVLLDLSSSMRGSRLRAARRLVQQLLAMGNYRVAVIVFHGQEARVLVPFTRYKFLIKERMAGLTPAGLTPLALGVQQATTYLSAHGRRGGRLFLLTDGAPTWSAGTDNPLEAALEALKECVEKTGFSLTCIGLEGNREALLRMAQAGAGSLYVVDDFRSASLFSIAQNELQASRTVGQAALLSQPHSAPLSSLEKSFF